MTINVKNCEQVLCVFVFSTREDMADISDYSCFACLSDHAGRQKCFVSNELFAKLKVNLGQVVWVTFSGSKYLCTVWPRKDQCKSHVYVDKTVQLKGDKWNNTTDSESQIMIAPEKEEAFISLDIILSNYAQVEFYKQNLPLLEEKLRELLHFTVVSPSCIVKADSLPLGSLYGIKLVIVSSTDSNNSSYCSVSEKTKLTIKNIESAERYQQRNKFKEIKLGGLVQAKLLFKEMLDTLFTKREVFKELNMPCPRSVLLRGPPGTGKSSLVKLMGYQSSAYVLTLTGTEVTASRPGEMEDNLRETFHKARAISAEGPCILFIDEVDSFCSKKGKGGANERRVLSQLLSLMDELQESEHAIMVVAATNRPAHLDPALRRPGRLDREIFIGIPTQSDREDILHTLLSDVSLSDDVSVQELAEATPGYVGADLRLLVQQACFNASMTRDCKMSLSVHHADFLVALHTTVPSSQKTSDVFVDHKPVQWGDIGGLEEVKAQIKQFIELPIKHPEAFHRLGLPPPRGVLLYGPPGCAKTTLVRAAATNCHVTFLSVSGAQLYSPFVGDSEKKIAEIFHQARAGAPCILFMDEIDSVVGSRSGEARQGSVQERVLSTLLNEMDGVGVRVDSLTSHTQDRVAEGEQINTQEGQATTREDNKSVLFVAATNRPDKLDDAILRPGRIDRIIFFPPPDLKTRVEILRVHTSKMSVDKDVDIENIATRTEHFTGADLENLCREAGMHALSVDGIGAACVKQEHFEAVLSTTQPSLSVEQLQQYSQYLASKYTS